MAIRIKVSEMLGRHKMTQKDLALRAGIRPATVSAMYHETIRRLEVEHLDALCRVFRCQPGDLLEYVPDEESAGEAGGGRQNGNAPAGAGAG